VTVTLSAENLGSLPPGVPGPAYDRSKVTQGIVHFGLGAFHRAHQAMYLDLLMNEGKALDWGICGVGVLPADAGMRDVLSTDVDKLTGLVTFAVTLPDSALARHTAQRILAVASRTFVEVMRSQASDQREAGRAQVDSTLRQLRAMEARLQNFQTSHRVYAPYSPAATERQRIDRDLQAAQSAYADALSDRQSAIARELSELPAVVVVDPIPPELTKVPRQAVLKLMLAAVLGLLAAGLVLAAQGEFRPQPVRLPLTEPRLVPTAVSVTAAGS